MKNNFSIEEFEQAASCHIYETLKDMTMDEETAYWACRTEQLRREAAEAKAQDREDALSQERKDARFAGVA